MYNISTAIAIICKSHVLCTSDFFSLSNYTSGLVKLFDALSQLLKWLDHLVLHCTDEAKLDQNSYLAAVCTLGTIPFSFRGNH